MTANTRRPHKRRLMLHKYDLENVPRAFSKLIKITERHCSPELQHGHKSRRQREGILVHKQLRQFVISGFRPDVDEICPLMGYGAALNGNSLPKLRNNISVPSSRVKTTS